MAGSCVWLSVEIAVWKESKGKKKGKRFSEEAKEVVKFKVIIRIYVFTTLEAFQVVSRIIC